MAPDGPETVLVDPIAWTADTSERRTPGSESYSGIDCILVDRASRLRDSGPPVGGSSTTSLMLGSSISNGGGGGGKGSGMVVQAVLLSGTLATRKTTVKLMYSPFSPPALLTLGIK